MSGSCNCAICEAQLNNMLNKYQNNSERSDLHAAVSADHKLDSHKIVDALGVLTTQTRIELDMNLCSISNYEEKEINFNETLTKIWDCLGDSVSSDLMEGLNNDSCEAFSESTDNSFPLITDQTTTKRLKTHDNGNEPPSSPHSEDSQQSGLNKPLILKTATIKADGEIKKHSRHICQFTDCTRMAQGLFFHLLEVSTHSKRTV